MLATLADEAFSDPNWVYERKLDGQRCLGFVDRGRVRLRSRNRKDLNRTYPELVEAVAGQPVEDVVVDGEVVAFEGDRTSFARLQLRMHAADPDQARRSAVPVYYYLFDVLHLDGHDCTGLALRTRKSLLQAAVPFAEPLRFCAHRNRDRPEPPLNPGWIKAFHADACDKGWEGLIAKRASLAYAGRRSRDCLKLKCVRGQELVIGGFTDPRGSRAGFGALLVGYYDDGDLVYAGKVGTGYDDDTLRDLRARMDRLERDEPAFTRGELPTKGVHWVEPRLVGQFSFTEWTDDGRLRHPRFEGLRRDKQPHEAVRPRAHGHRHRRRPHPGDFASGQGAVPRATASSRAGPGSVLPPYDTVVARVRRAEEPPGGHMQPRQFRAARVWRAWWVLTTPLFLAVGSTLWVPGYQPGDVAFSVLAR